MRLQFSTTSIVTDFLAAVKPLNFDIGADDVVNITEAIVRGVAEFLNLKKSIEAKKTSLVIKDDKDNFLLAAMVEFHESTDPETKGNWSYSMTFYPEDVTDVTEGNVYYITNNDDLHAMLDTVGHKLHNMRFTQVVHTNTLIRKTFGTIKNWLDINAKENEPVEVEFKGYFLATVAVENGVKYFAIEPDGEMKRLVKDDDALSA